MAATEYSTDYTKPATETPTEPTSSVFDLRYVPHYKDFVFRIRGWLKIVETSCSLIAFICAIAAPMGVWVSTYTYFKFISMTSFIVTSIYWILLLFMIPSRICRCSCFNWLFVDLTFYGGTSILLFFGDLFLALHAANAAHEAACAFGFFALFAYLGDTGLSGCSFYAHRKQLKQEASYGASTTTGTQY